MHSTSALLEIFRWGYAHVPGVLFTYSKELDLDMEDIGVLAAILYAHEVKSKPLFERGITTGQILQCCPTLTKNKLSRRLLKFSNQNIIDIIEEGSKNFTDKKVQLEPLLEKLEEIITRDHPQLSFVQNEKTKDDEKIEYLEKIKQLENELEEERNKKIAYTETLGNSDNNYKKVADFISKKTGNLMSVKMSNELKKWLQEMSLTPEYLLCMLELCFEREIYNPKEITNIAKDLVEYSIQSVEGLELYFNKYVDNEKNTIIRNNKFDPDIQEFGSFTGIDMIAEARKRIYYKWRYDWGFTHSMIMKAGEIMCQRTKNGGLEYIDSVLNNWLKKEIRSIEEAEKEFQDFKNKNKREKSSTANIKKENQRSNKDEYEIYVKPVPLDDIKSNV
ncbi:DNA replication protein DnaD [Candidatus Syntrophocurvum alkaliphilum]|uniref:DNA replication protein DnaD n=1 Tax=Candidatus Syntrophocurvum alkaliphilum TaxID=2293317 RepID=A0A6I6DB66_9FIRM|nr:DnaD domain protein [Candidatus Syntrophocurvum alkaliphilum]QGT99559.1 DNA replication protein DnaD [Candidatus Syntrophocurvum alkaliphilum]